MTLKDAFATLGLDITASAAEIDAAYRRLVREAHPDTGGSVEAMARLNEAREVALQATTTTALVPVDFLRALATRDERAEKKAEQKQVAESTQRQVVSHAIGRTRALRRLAALTSGSSAALGAFVQLLRSDVIPGGLPAQYLPLIPMLLICAGIFGAMYVVIRLATDTLKATIEDIGESFQDKDVLLDVLQEILSGGRLSGWWTKWQFYSAIREWAGPRRGPIAAALLGSAMFPSVLFSSSIPRLSRTLGPVDFARLVITRALAADVLEEKERFDGGRLVLVYRLRLPSVAGDTGMVDSSQEQRGPSD
jgi:DnaJ-like protein